MQGDLIDQANVLLNTYVIPFGLKILGAIAVWIVGGWIIKVLRAAARFAVPERRLATRSLS